MPWWNKECGISIQITCRPISVCSFQELHLVGETSGSNESQNMSLLSRQMNTYQEKDVLSLNQTSLRSSTETQELSTISFMFNSTILPDKEAIGIVVKTSDAFNVTISPIQIVSASEEFSRVETESILTSSPAERIPGEMERESTSIEPTTLDSIESTDIEVQSDESYSSKSIISSQSSNSSKKGSVPKSVDISSSSVSKKTKKAKKRSLFTSGRDAKDRERIMSHRKVLDSVVNAPDPFEVQWRAASESHSHW